MGDIQTTEAMAQVRQETLDEVRELLKDITDGIELLTHYDLVAAILGLQEKVAALGGKT
jgi:hypothetical protein